MKELAYSSTAAFLAHYRVLDNTAEGRPHTHPLSAEEHQTLSAMRQVLEALTPEDRRILFSDKGADTTSLSTEERRRRERAHLKLNRLLVSKGIVRG
jgi:hypothetical protein